MCDGGDGCAVKVAVRIRPLLEKEVAEQARVCSRVINDHQVVLGKDRAFTFDNLFDENAAQKEIYDACISSLMTQFFKGYNCTILAYGQTGSGKTHTMGTGDLSRVSPEEQGIVPRVARDIFATIKEKKRRAARSGVDLSITCRLSYIEIYNEALKDLLRPSTPSRHLQIREDSSGEIVVTGVYEQEVSSCEDMIQQLQIGTFARTTGSTLMNESSSRSHSILTVILVQHQMSAADVAVMGGSSRGRVKGATVSKLHLVDLAGSERNKKTQAVGQRFRESVSINSGLLALGNVISVLGEQNAPPSAAPTSTRPANSPSEPAHTGGDLAENNTTTTTTTQHQQQQQQQREEVPGGGVAAEEAEQGVGHLSDSFARRSLAPEGSEGLKAAAAIDGGAVSAGGALPAAARRTHVPYRDSKLTRLLQDSLGGNASTLMIACVSPADSNFEETLNTLKYANRAKNIRNKPVINADPRQLVADRLRNELAACKKALAAHGIQDPTAAAAEGGGDAAAEGLQSAASALSGGVCSRKACAAARGQLAACRLALAANGVPEPGGGGGGDAPAERCRELQQEYGTMEADLTASLHDEPAAKLARCALTPAEASACLQWAETQPVPPDAAAHYALLAFLKARSEEQLPDYSNNDDDAAAAAPPSAAADLLAAEKLTPFGNTRQNQCNAAASGGRPATKPAGQQQQQQQQQAPPAAGESLKHLVPSSMLLTGTIPVALTDAFDPEGSSAVERVIDENQKLLRNLKQLEDDLFRSECFAVRETEERSKLLDAFATTREENLALKQQNESLRTRLLLTASMESDARNETKVSLERLEAEIARMNAERGALSQAKRRTEDEKKRLEKNARAMQQVYQREHGDMQQQLRTLAQEIEHKASLVDDLVEREKRLARAKQQNEKAMQLMEAEKERLRQELERALRRLEDSEHVGEKLERMQEDLRRQYEARLKEQDANLQGMRKKQRNAQQLLRQQGSDYQKIQKLLSEVSHLRTEQGELKNAMKYKCDEREAERDQRTKQLNQLQRQMRQLETQNVRYSNSLKVKEETLNRLQQQLSVEKTKTKHLSEIQKEVEKKQTWLDKEIEIQRKKHEAQERLSRELKRRERILKEREDNQSARDDMRKTKERSNFGRLERGLQGWDSQITSIEAKLKKARSEQECIPPQNRHAENSAFAEVTSEIDCLEAELASARIKYQEVQQAHLEAAELDNQLRHIDDRIDVLQAALEYGEDIIHQTEREIEDLTKAGQTVADQVAAAEERGGTCESPETQPASGTPPPPASLPPAASCPKQLLDPLFDTPRPPASNAPSTAPASQPPATTPRRASAGGEQDGSVRTASSEGGDAAGTAVCSGGSVSPAPAGSQEAAKQAGNPPSVTPPFRPSDAPSAGCRSAGDDLTPPPASSLTPADCIALLASPGSSEQQQQPQQPPPCAKQPTAEEFQKTLQQYARKVRVLNQAERTREQEVQGLRRQHDEQAQTIEKLRNALRLADMGFNRRLLKVQLEHEKILSRLIVNSSDSSSVVQ